MMAADHVPRRRRRCGPKVKSGCQTCKYRHVKCDEAKPSCQRCTSTGRKCDGYEYPQNSVGSSVDGPGLTVVQRISTHIPGNANEKRGFNYFILQTSAELSGYFDTSFWQRILLQASTVEPALRHAVIGLGTLHESFTKKRLDYSPNNIEQGFAIDQYTKAIGHLRRSLATGKQAPLTALMSCVLFVCFDSIRGHFESAMVHLQSGLRILSDMKTKSAEEDHVMTSMLAPTLMRLGIQAILYVDTRKTADRQAFALDLMNLNCREADVPNHFETLDEARKYMDQAANGLFRMFYMCDGALPTCYQPEEALAVYEKYTKQLVQWNTTFEKLVKEKTNSLSSKELRGAALLKIQHTTAMIMGNVAPPNPSDLRPAAEAVNAPESFLPHVDNFRTIVNLSRSLIAASETDSRSGRSPLTFSTDLGLIGPLYYCCIKCPDRAIRLAAMEALLRCPRREGMWDSVAGIRMIREFWEIEERHQAFQREAKDKDVLPVPLNEALDLEFRDGMKWEWKWKQPIVMSRETIPDHYWTENLEDQSLFDD